MNEKFEKTIGFKVLMACPVPGVDVALGMAAQGISDSIKNSASEFISNAVSEGSSAAVAEIEAALNRQTKPLSDGLTQIAKAVASFSEK